MSVDFHFFSGVFYGIFCVMTVPTGATKVLVGVDFQFFSGFLLDFFVF